VDHSLFTTYQECLEDLPHVFNHAISIVDNSLVLEKAKIEKKRDLKKKTFTDVDKHISLKSI